VGQNDPNAQSVQHSPVERRLVVDRLPGSHTLVLWGQIPENDPGWMESVAMDDPPRVAGEFLLQELTRRGVQFMGTVRVHRLESFDVPDLRGEASHEIPRKKMVELGFHQSAPLADSLKVITKVSQNLHAEMLLRTLGREKRNVGSVEAGLEEVSEFLREIGVAGDQVALRDGSGLSRQSLVSPAAMVALLRSMHGSRYSSTWIDLLPVAGLDGSLADRLRGRGVEGRIHAKTGSLAGVASLVGYITGPNREPLAFAIFVNHHNLTSAAATGLIDRIVEEISRGW